MRNQIYKELNSITYKEGLTKFLSNYFAGQAEVKFILKQELQNIDENLRLIPLGKDGKFAGYIVFENINLINNIWYIFNKYYQELSAIALRIQTHEQNYSTIKHVGVLNNIQTLANLNIKFSDVCHRIAKEIGKVIEFDRMSLSLISENKKAVELTAVYDEGETFLNTGKIFYIANTVQEWLLKNKKPLFVRNLKNKQMFKEDAMLASEGYLSSLHVPMVFKDEIIGGINFNSKKTDNFSKFDAEFALKAATVLSYAVINNKIINQIKLQTEETAKENRQLRILNKALNTLSDAQEFKSAIKDILEEVVKEFDLYGAECFINFNNKLKLENSYFCNSNTRKTEFTKNLITKLKSVKVAVDDNLETMYIPIKIKDKLAAVLVFHGQSHNFYHTEKKFLDAFIKQLAIVVENTILFRTIKFAAEFDALTGLYNKNKFFALLRREIARSKRSGEKLAVLILDIDGFKEFNDSYGHLAGDKVLKQVSHIISNNLRKSDIAGRFGGEEFLILLPNSEVNLAKDFAKRLADRIHLETGKKNITVSIGVAELDLDKDDAVSLVKRADDALYNAKNQGKNQIVVALEG